MAKNPNARTSSSKSSRRFNSESNAKSFARKLGVEVSDLRDQENRKSDFKVTYTKGQAKKAFENDFDHHEDDDEYWID